MHKKRWETIHIAFNCKNILNFEEMIHVSICKCHNFEQHNAPSIVTHHFLCENDTKIITHHSLNKYLHKKMNNYLPNI